MALAHHFEKYAGKDPFSDILGQNITKKQLLSTLIANRHVVLVGPPGVGKTTLGKNIAALLPEIEVFDCPYHCSLQNPICPQCIKGKSKKRMIQGAERFIRIQGSPDLTVEDLLGDIDPMKALEFGPLALESFTPGKIFKANNGVLFFDEINRCPEKLQNALLQVLQEGYVTIGSYDVNFPTNFIFIATMNPDDFTGTEKLSEVLLDRFDLIYVSYPETVDIEEEIVRTKGNAIQGIQFPQPLLQQVLEFIHHLRKSDKLERVPSVRASLGLYERAQSFAFLNKRKEVHFDDIKEAMTSVLAHRMTLKPSVKYVMAPEQFIKKEFEQYREENKESDVP